MTTATMGRRLLILLLRLLHLLQPRLRARAVEAGFAPSTSTLTVPEPVEQ